VRSLSPDEAQLWAKVAETIRPLSRDRDRATKPEAKPQPAELPTAEAQPQPAPRPAKPPQPKPKPGPGSTLDGTWDRKLRSGNVTIDRTLDLHGMSLDGAWAAIDHLLEQAISDGDRLLLLITGHARKGEPPVQRGKIRAAVHDWLAASRQASRIASVRNAHPRHGGGGSLYIILRRG
jgi:DNA-nicking Smr family endonuclease